MAGQPTLEELVVERGLLKARQVEKLQRRAEQEQKTFEQIVREDKLIYPEPLAQLKAEALGLPYIDVSSIEVDQRAMQGVSPQAARTYQFIAFAIEENRLRVAMASPENYQAQEAVRFIAAEQHLTPDIYCASPEAIAKAFQKPATDIKQALKDFGREFKQAAAMPHENERLRAALAKAPVTKIVAVIIRHAIEGLASDIHIEPGAKEIRVRYRISGQLHTSLLFPAETMTAIASRIKVLAGLPVNAKAGPQEGRFTFATDEQSFSIRVASMPTISGERITLRLADVSSPPPSLAELGMTEPQQTLFTKHLHAPDGIITIAGPGRDGKSDTLLSSLGEVNAPNVAVATLEDSIELEIPGISQTAIRPHEGLTYAGALASILRQDFDVVLLARIPSGQVAKLATRAAMSGKLIICGISAPDVVQTIEQLRALDVSPYLIAASMRLFVAQRVVPKLCPSCRQAVVIPREVRTEITAELKKVPQSYLRDLALPAKRSFFNSPGCPDCHEGKATGQIALFEMVPSFPKLRQAIISGADSTVLEQTIRAKGYLSLRQDGIIKALQGKVRYADVVRATA
jgi:type IV pilus assembly protein PilB